MGAWDHCSSHSSSVPFFLTLGRIANVRPNANMDKHYEYFAPLPTFFPIAVRKCDSPFLFFRAFSNDGRSDVFDFAPAFFPAVRIKWKTCGKSQKKNSDMGKFLRLHDGSIRRQKCVVLGAIICHPPPLSQGPVSLFSICPKESTLRPQKKNLNSVVNRCVD